jgi:ligand-binding SRPBCC domain-containing protein
MPILRIATEIAAPVETCFDLARSIDLHLESMITSNERAVAGVTSGLISAGQEVTWEARHLGRLWRMTSRITEFDRPHRFVDQMVRGPFGSFRHEHRFEPVAGGTQMTDVVTFRMGWGLFGRLVDPFAAFYLRRLMVLRNTAIQGKAEGPAPEHPSSL